MGRFEAAIILVWMSGIAFGVWLPTEAWSMLGVSVLNGAAGLYIGYLGRNSGD